MATPPVLKHAGTKLGVHFDPQSAGCLLHSHVERLDVGALEQKSAAMREAVREKGWIELLAEVHAEN